MMLDSYKRDLPHVALDQTQSDFSPTQTIYFADTHQNVPISSTPASSPPPSELSMDIDLPLLSDFALNSMEHISSLERALCSNFTCCNIQLPDLHALVEHVEEQHVVVFDLDGMRIYPENLGKRLAFFPPPPSLSHSPTSSCSSSAVSSPQTPTTPLFASFPTSDVIQKPKASTTSPCHQVYTPFNLSSTMPDSEYGIGLFDLEIGPDPYPILTNPLIDGYMTSSSSPESLNKSPCSSTNPISKSHDTTALPDSDVSISGSTSFGDLRTVASTITSHASPKSRAREKEKEKKARNKADIVNATAVSAKNTVKAKARVTGGNAKRREKAYRCPTPKCTKSYLNPNGLKYHLEKGTCRFEDSTDSEASSENIRSTAPTCPTAPSTTPAPPPSHPALPLTNANTLLPTGGNSISHHQPNLLPSRKASDGKMAAVNSIPTPPATPSSPSPPSSSSSSPLSIPSTAYRISSSTSTSTPTLTHSATSSLSTSSC